MAAGQRSGRNDLADVDPPLLGGDVGADELAPGSGLFQDVAIPDEQQSARGRAYLQDAVEDGRLYRGEQQPAPADIRLVPLAPQHGQPPGEVVARGSEALVTVTVRHAPFRQLTQLGLQAFGLPVA